MKPRKQPESPPPGDYIRSKSGTPGRLVKTREWNEHDEWLYRIDFGSVTGQHRFSVADLEAAGCTFLSERPDDMPTRGEEVS